MGEACREHVWNNKAIFTLKGEEEEWKLLFSRKQSKEKYI
jgi:hypothetical protein